MKTLDVAKEALSNWARSESFIERVYLFGSRVRGNAKTESDLDVAIVLCDVPGDSSTLIWMEQSGRWRKHLSGLLPYEVDLQLLDAHTPTVAEGVDEASELIFDRSAPGAQMKLATIYVYLLNEGTDVWRPIEAEYLGSDRYRITSVNADPDDEQWQFRTGDIVHCSERLLSGGPALVAVVADQHSAQRPCKRDQ